MKENSLHAEIKRWYAQPGDLVEAVVDGLLIDIVRQSLLIEIQTSHFYSIRDKLTKLLPNHKIRIVYPVALVKWVSRYNPGQNEIVGRRKSPLHNRIENIFDDLVYITAFAPHPNISFELIVIEQEDIFLNDGKGSWRRDNWSIRDRKLLSIYDRVVILRKEDFRTMLPDDLPEFFSFQDLVSRMTISPKLARKMLYCLSRMGLLEIGDRRRVGILYKLAD